MERPARAPRERGECELERDAHGLGTVAAALGRQHPEVLARLGDRRREVEGLRLPFVAPIPIADDCDAHASRDALHEEHEGVDPRLALGQLGAHAGRAVEEDRDVDLARSEVADVPFERHESFGVELGKDPAVALRRTLCDHEAAVQPQVAPVLPKPLAPPVAASAVAARRDRRQARRKVPGLDPVHAHHDREHQLIAIDEGAVHRPGEGELERQHPTLDLRALRQSHDKRLELAPGKLVTAAQRRPDHARLALAEEVFGCDADVPPGAREKRVAANLPRSVREELPKVDLARLAAKSGEPLAGDGPPHPRRALAQPFYRVSLRLGSRRQGRPSRRGRCRVHVRCGGDDRSIRLPGVRRDRRHGGDEMDDERDRKCRCGDESARHVHVPSIASPNARRSRIPAKDRDFTVPAHVVATRPALAPE